MAWARLPCHASFNSCSLVWDMTWKYYRRREKYCNALKKPFAFDPPRPRFQCCAQTSCAHRFARSQHIQNLNIEIWGMGEKLCLGTLQNTFRLPLERPGWLVFSLIPATGSSAGGHVTIVFWEGVTSQITQFPFTVWLECVICHCLHLPKLQRHTTTIIYVTLVPSSHHPARRHSHSTPARRTRP